MLCDKLKGARYGRALYNKSMEHGMIDRESRSRPGSREYQTLGKALPYQQETANAHTKAVRMTPKDMMMLNRKKAGKLSSKSRQ